MLTKDILGPSFIGAHILDFTDEEIDLCAATGMMCTTRHQMR